MADKPISFKPDLIRAVSGGHKLRTRRLPRRGGITYAVGDRVWVREPWRVSNRWDATAPRDLPPKTMTVFFEAGGSLANQDGKGDWRPVDWPIGETEVPGWVGKYRAGMHLPRWASRWTLIITEARLERLHEITEADARLEGAPWTGFEAMIGDDPSISDGYRCGFAALWDRINGAGAWASNPMVHAYSFTAHRGNIDAEGAPK